MASNKNTMQSTSSSSTATNNAKNYNTLIDFAKFLRENGDKLFEKDSKLCIQTEQLLILQDYLQQITSYTSSSSNSSASDLLSRKQSSQIYTKEFLQLYKSNQLHLIQDFLYKITSLKIIAENPLNYSKDYLKLSIFGSLTYLEIKNCSINNINDLQNLRNQLEVLICIKCISKVNDLLHLCGADQSSPFNWPKLHTLNLSYNQLNSIDSSFRLTSSIENLDLSHNNIKDCSSHLHCLVNLKRLNLSFNKLESFPSISQPDQRSTCQYLDLSYNNIEKLNEESLKTLASLVHLNLTNNLIGDLNEITKLSNLSSTKQILVDRNPIVHNAKCMPLINEILFVNNNNRNRFKNVNATQAYQRSSTFSKYSSSRPLQVALNKNSKLSDQQNVVTKTKRSASGINSFGGTHLAGSYMKRKLKVNNIFIESEPQTNEDFVIVGRNADNEQVDSQNEKQQENSDPLTNNLATLLSSSYGKEYDPNDLQKELENLKKMRQNYGTDWLLSAPSYVSNLKQQQQQQQHQKELEQPSNSDGNKSKQLEDPNLSQSELFQKQTAALMQHQMSFRNDQSINETIETFAVYKCEEIIGQSFENEDRKLCIITLNDKYLVERDETNSEILNLNEWIYLSEALHLKREDEKANEIKITFKNSITNTIYEFENENELNDFVRSLRKILFNRINLFASDMYFCDWCNEFNKKSLFKITDDSIEINKSSDENSGDNNLTCNKCNRYLIKDNYILNKDGTREELKSKQAATTNSDTPKTDLSSTQLKFLSETNTKTLSNNQLSSTPSHHQKERQPPINPNLSSTFNQPSDDQILSTGYTLKDVLKSLKSTDNETIHIDVSFNLDNSGTNLSGQEEEEEEGENRPDESSILMHENQQKLSRMALSTDNDLALSYLLNSKNDPRQDTNPDLSRMINELTRVSEVASTDQQESSVKNPVDNNITNADQNQMIQSLLNNNQITKAKLDEISNECKRINNNLKLFLIINVLNDSQSSSDQHQNQVSASYTATTSGFMQRFESPQQTNEFNSQQSKFNEEETLVCSFKLKYFYYNSLPSAQHVNTNVTNQKVTGLSCVDIKSIENCLCVFTNHNVTLLKITNSQLFSQNSDFEKCLKKEFSININKIETIEVSLGQHYVLIEYATPSVPSEAAESGADHSLTMSPKRFVSSLNPLSPKTPPVKQMPSSATTTDTPKKLFKFVTNDIFQTQTFLNMILKIINESKNHPLLKQIKKYNPLTNQNLIEQILWHIDSKTEFDPAQLPISLFTFLDELKINDEYPHSQLNNSSSNDSSSGSSDLIPTFAKELIVYNDEKLILIEERLSYLNLDEVRPLKLQYYLLDQAKISDIVHLKLFKESDTKLEISFVDESKNSKQINWTFNLNKQFVLSQLINQLKVVWEKMFLVELPINY